MIDSGMDVRFVNHFVAFVDLLGFKEMVAHDVRAPQRRYLERLFAAHTLARDFAQKTEVELDVQQFSDSVVFSAEVKGGVRARFLATVQTFQAELFFHGLLCRGGVSYGRHFSEGSFVFSDALINAYNIEKDAAKYPRIVVSQDVLDLFPEEGVPPCILREDDDFSFIDYLAATGVNQAIVEETLTELIKTRPRSPSVNEKLRWLAAYVDFKYGTSHAGARFVA